MTLSVTNLGIDGLEDVEQIGTGGSSRVYRARQVELDRVVAVKVLNPGGDQGVARRFDRERKAMGRLSLHEGIVPIYSSGVTTHGEPYLVMPYYANGSLQDQIEAGPLEWETAVSYVDVAAETIAAAHEEGIVHLDLKPANILLTNTGAPRIADFGIARLTGVATAGTTAGTAFTPAYSAPETFLDGETGPPSDVYGLGATLWALLVGHPPFLTPGDDSNLMAVIGRVVNNQVGDLRHVAPGPICDVIERAMAKRPEDRYQSASEFSLALKQAAAGVSPNFAPPAGATDPGNALFPSAPATTQAPAGLSVPAADSQTTVHQVDQTVAAPGSRTLLQETAQPLPKPVNGPPGVTQGPFIDLDRFRFGPILLGALAFIVIVGAASWSFFRDPGTTTSGEGDPIQDPAGATTEVTVSSTTATTGGSDGSSSTTDAGTSTSTASSASTTTSIGDDATTSSSDTTTSESSSTTEESTTTTEESTTTTEDTSTSSSSSSSSSSSTSSSTTSTTIVDAIQPPASLSAAAGDDGTSVDLTWTPPASGPAPEGYRLFRNGSVLRQQLGAGRTSFTDTNLDAGTYAYTIRAIGEDDELSSGTSATISIGPLAINSFTVDRSDPERVTASFSTNKCVTAYTFSAVPTGGGATVSDTGPASGCVDSATAILGGLDETADYQVNIRVRVDQEVESDFRQAPAPNPGP